MAVHNYIPALFNTRSIIITCVCVFLKKHKHLMTMFTKLQTGFLVISTWDTKHPTKNTHVYHK